MDICVLRMEGDSNDRKFITKRYNALSSILNVFLCYELLLWLQKYTFRIFLENISTIIPSIDSSEI